MNCPTCQRENYDKTKECVWCGATLNNPFQRKEKPIQPEILDEKTYQKKQTNSTNVSSEPKQRVIAGILALFVGGLGIHNFYLGYTEKAVIQLLLSTVGWIVGIGPVIAGVWAFIEGIQILTGDIKVDGKGQPLV
jgi:TM2 domain-containing membrane protein YozV